MEEPRRRSIRVLTPERGTPADVSEGQYVELAGAGLYVVSLDPMTGVVDLRRLTRRECGELALVDVVDCPKCRAGTPVGHLGSYLCRSGSLRAGGTRSHCTCDTCY